MFIGMTYAIVPSERVPRKWILLKLSPTLNPEINTLYVKVEATRQISSSFFSRYISVLMTYPPRHLRGYRSTPQSFSAVPAVSAPVVS